MDLSFQEKSAGGLLAGIVVVSYFYFPAAFDVARDAPDGLSLVGVSIAGVVALIVIEGIYHAFIASARGSAATDERDKLIDLKSERNAGFVLGIGLFSLVGHIIVSHTVPNLASVGALTIVVWILFALTVSEVAKLISQLWFYRIGVG